MIRVFVCALATLLLMTAQQVDGHAAERLTVTMKVTAQGLTVSGIPMKDRRMTIPRGTPVRLVFEYADVNRNAHKFTLTAGSAEITAPVIDGETRKTATIDFTAGDRGQGFYRLSCELPCVAMDQLIDYLIMVGPPRTAA